MSAILILILGTTVPAPGAGAAAGTAPGAFEDPVITKSYLEQILNKIFQPKVNQISDLERQLNDLEASLEELRGKIVPFADIKGHWARENISYLYFKGITGGFPDGTFKPNETVTRAQLAALLVRAKGLTKINPAAAENPFSDLKKNHWGYADVLTARQAGIIGGYADGTFQPDRPVNRAEIAAMLDRAFSLQGTRESIPFSDVAGNHWAKAHVDALAKAGITAGYLDKTFKPGSNATRAEVAAFISRALEPGFR
jgi:hypothetical protein